jgi:hypothetical protein
MPPRDLEHERTQIEPTPDTTQATPQPLEPNVPELEAFQRGIDDAVAAISDDEVQDGLNRLRQAVQRKAGLNHEALETIVADQARYAYQVVACWFTIIFDTGEAQLESEPRVDNTDVHALARETVARAAVGFREELERIRPWLRHERLGFTRMFLLECLLHIPDAYQWWLRVKDHVSWDGVEQIGASHSAPSSSELLRRLTQQVRNDRARVIFRLRHSGLPGAGEGWSEFTDAAATEIVDATLDMLDEAAHAWVPESEGHS